MGKERFLNGIELLTVRRSRLALKICDCTQSFTKRFPKVFNGFEAKREPQRAYVDAERMELLGRVGAVARGYRMAQRGSCVTQTWTKGNGVLDRSDELICFLVIAA